MIHYGIVGIGGFAQTWLQCLRVLEQKGIARLTAAVVRNPAKYAREVAELEARGCTIYARFREMLAQERGRVGVVGLPIGIPYHTPMATQAMEAGHNVLVEKPVAATVQEVAHLEEAERRTGRWCAVGYQFLFSPTIRWLRDKLAGGELGDILEAKCVIGWPRTARYYARNAWAGQLRHDGRWVLDGPATNATAHYLTNMLYLVAAQQGGDAQVSSVRGELYRAKPIPSYDTSCIEVQMQGARVLHYASHSLSRQLDPVMTISCEGATVGWTGHDNAAVIRYSDGREERYADPDMGYLHARSFEQVARVAAGRKPAPLCGLREAGPHVLAINLAFESSGGVLLVPEKHTYRTEGADGAELVAIRGMEEVLREAQARGVMYSELDLPWGQATEPVDAQGYLRFPGSSVLEATV